jgi:hypothetical protein
MKHNEPVGKLSPLECFTLTFHRLAAQLCIQSFEIPGVGVFRVADQYSAGSRLPVSRSIEMRWEAHSVLEKFKANVNVTNIEGLAQSPFGVLFGLGRGILRDKAHVVEDYLIALHEIVALIEQDEEWDMGGLGKLYMMPLKKMDAKYQLQLDMINPLHENVCLYTAPVFDWGEINRLLQKSWIMPDSILDLENETQASVTMIELNQVMKAAAMADYVASLSVLRNPKTGSLSRGLRTLLDWEISQRAFFFTDDDSWLREHI